MSIEQLTKTEDQEPSFSEMLKKSMPKLSWKPSTENVPEQDGETDTTRRVAKKRAPRRRTPDPTGMVGADATRRAADDEETVRKRDILVSVSVLGELEGYVGENIPASKIGTMKRDQLEVHFLAHEAKLGQEMTRDSMNAVVGTVVKAIGFVVPLDDEEALMEDLLENKPLRRSLGRHCASVAERYGDFVAFVKVICDVVNHIKFEETTETPSVGSGDENKQ